MQETKYILAIDEGTSSTRAIIFDKKGQIKGIGRNDFEQFYPQPGWVEHDGEEIWLKTLDSIHQAVKNAQIEFSQIEAIGITNQRETTLLWDKTTGKPIAKAIVWQDRRTSNFCQELKNQNLEENFQNKTGLLLDPYFSGTKINWLLKNNPQLILENIAFGTIDSFLIYKLTNGKIHATDVTNASRTLIYNIKNLSWDSELCSILEIPMYILPEVKSCSETFGFWEIEGCKIPICGVAGDQQAATFGQACFEQGMAKNTYGTGCFLLMNIGNQALKSNHKLLTTIAWKIGNEVTYAFEGAIFSAGSSIQWLEEVGIVKDVKELTSLAESLDDNEGVYLVPAFAGLGSPQWDPNARGTLLGLTRGSTKANLARAALESMAFQSDEVLSLMQKDSKIDLKILRVDGGATNNNLLMQFQSDISQVEIQKPETVETTALGVAFLAGLVTGYWKNLDEITEIWHKNASFYPKMNLEKVDSLKKQWQKAVSRSLNWVEE